MPSPREALESMFEADRTLRAAEKKLMKTKPDALVPLLRQAVDEAIALDDIKEGSMRLRLLADLCAQVEGPEMVETLIEILDYEGPVARVEAMDALLDVGYARYAEVARAIERALDEGRDSHAMCELPHVLAEIGEPSALVLIKRFLEHPNADAVAAALESLATLGEPEAIDALAQFVDDTREVTLDDDDDVTRTTIGELAREVMSALEG